MRDVARLFKSGGSEAEPVFGCLGSVEPVAKPTYWSVLLFLEVESEDENILCGDGAGHGAVPGSGGGRGGRPGTAGEGGDDHVVRGRHLRTSW